MAERADDIFSGKLDRSRLSASSNRDTKGGRGKGRARFVGRIGLSTGGPGQHLVSEKSAICCCQARRRGSGIFGIPPADPRALAPPRLRTHLRIHITTSRTPRAFVYFFCSAPQPGVLAPGVGRWWFRQRRRETASDRRDNGGVESQGRGMRGRNNHRLRYRDDLSSRRNPANLRFAWTSRYFPSLLREREKERERERDRRRGYLEGAPLYSNRVSAMVPASPRCFELDTVTFPEAPLPAARRRGSESAKKRERKRERERERERESVVFGPRNHRNCVRRRESWRGLRCQRLRHRVQLSEDVGRRCRLIPGTWPGQILTTKLPTGASHYFAAFLRYDFRFVWGDNRQACATTPPPSPPLPGQARIV